MTKPAPAPSNVDRQRRVASTPTTIITISMISTTETGNEVAKTAELSMASPYTQLESSCREL